MISQTNMKLESSIYISLLVMLSLYSTLPAVAATESGCCGVLSPSRPTPLFQTTTAEQCRTLNQNYAGSNYPFEAGKQASPDGKKCVEEAEPIEDKGPSEIVPPQLSVSIPGFSGFSKVTCDDSTTQCGIPWIAEYIQGIYTYSLLIIGILSVIVLMIGGVLRIMAAGNRQQISKANSLIGGSILGATIAICSYLILFLVNPNLLIFKPIGVTYLQKIDLEVLDKVSDVVDAPTDNEKYPSVSIYDPSKEKPSNVSGCDDCVVTSLTTKNNKNINKNLNAKLLQVRSNYGWRITEAYPPSSKHQSKCHYNGRCVDIAIYPPTTNCQMVRKFIEEVQATGLVVFNEYVGCDGSQTQYGSGGHLHVRE